MTGIRSLQPDQIIRSQKRLRRQLQEGKNLQPLKIAVLGGPTTNEVVNLLELLLLSDGFAPSFFQTDYNRFYEAATLDVRAVEQFQPNIVYVHTHIVSISSEVSPSFSEADLEACVATELSRYQQIWSSIHNHIGCQIIQNNFEHPPFPTMGNLDSAEAGGQTRFVSELNRAFARSAREDRRLLIHDLNSMAARIGLNRWFDWERWYSYKILTTPEGSFALANSLASLIGAILGRTRKCLILDLDNTLWGGVIGDDGVNKLEIGKETPLAEAYTAFQRYCLSMRQRGVLLAVCSKNDEAIARTGFAHPDSILKLEHFSAFKANWEPKPDNIRQIAAELNLGLDSFVFVDDNPAERAIVRAQLPMVAVPEVGADVTLFAEIIRASHLFEMVAISKEDLGRASAYAANTERLAGMSKFKDYGEYLDSLKMVAEIAPFKPIYLERITQLINKTNQFNLTTRRYTFADIERISHDATFTSLYGRLSDVYGDNGLVSVIIGRREGEVLHLDLWIMSCRVLKRDMECAMLDTLVQSARALGVLEIRGYYIRTPKNGMVADHYSNLGFEFVSAGADAVDSTWKLDVSSYQPRNKHINC